MRIATYAGLVIRRMWAKRGVLLGSILGATMVVSLLVIVPLYESSIAAVDLVFTFRQAPAVEVDLRASVTTTQYDAADALTAREAVLGAMTVLDPWYPVAIERTVTREFQIIPPGPPADWLGQAETWRDAAEAWITEVEALLGRSVRGLGRNPQEIAIQIPAQDLAAAVPEGTDPPEFPRPPYPTPPQEPTVTRFVTAPDIESHIEIVAGEWPDDQPDPAGQAAPRLQVVFGQDLAARSGLGVGDETIIKPFIGLADVFEIVEVVGIFAPFDPAEPLWAAVRPEDVMVIPPGVFDQWMAPIPLADLSRDPWLRPSRGFPAVTATQAWYLPLVRETVALENVAALRTSAASFSGDLGRVSGVAVSTALPGLIESFDVRKVVSGGPILAMLALVVSGALYFLIYTAGLTLERESPELALLRTRGASRWQTVGIHLFQSLAIAALAAAVAPFVARFLVSVTGRVPPMSDLTGGDALRVAQEDSLLPFILAGGVLTFVTMGLAVLPFARRSVLELRSLAARPARTSVWQRYYIDIFLVILAGILLFELRREGLVDVGQTEVGLDPFAIASPALFLFAGALVLLRVLPFILRGFGWLMTQIPGMGGALPGWHLGRNPIPYGRLALLIWLTTGFGAFALTYAGTLNQSYDDRAAYAAGSDVRLVADGAGFLTAPEGSTVAAVYRSQGAPRLASRGAELLAVRPGDFSEVVAWRSDFGAATAADLFGLLRPEGEAAVWGVELPAGAGALLIDAAMVPAGPPDASEGPDPLQIVVRLVDGVGRFWTLEGPPLSDREWTTSTITLDDSSALNAGPATIPEPISIQSLWVERRVSGGGEIVGDEEVVFDGIRAATPSGEVDLTAVVGDRLTPRNLLAVDEVDGDYAARASLERGASAVAVAASPLNRPGPLTVWRLRSTGRISPVPHIRSDPAEIRVLLDGAAAAAAAINIGDTATYGINALQIPGVLVGTIELLPTAVNTTTTGLMVADLDALMAWLNGEPTWSLTGTLSRLDVADELWVKTDDPDAAVRRLLGELAGEPRAVVTAQGAAVDFSSRPVQVGLVAILFVGAATGVVLALAGVTGYVLLAVRRRAREMGVLRALGFGRRGVAATFAVEQLVVLVLGAVIGVAAGVALMRVLIPFLQLGETATVLVPPVVLRLNLVVLGAYLSVVATLLVLSVLWATRDVSARRLSEVLREGDR